MAYIIYIYENLINGKIYIGQTKTTLEKRSRHNGIGYKKSIVFYNAIKKYGWNNFSAQIITEVDTIEQANYAEEDWIIRARELLGKENVYNAAAGGSNCVMSEETKKKISLANKGKKHTNQTKNKISLSHMGKKLSQNTKDKLSKTNKGRLPPNTGKKHTNEAKEKMSKRAKEREHKTKLNQEIELKICDLYNLGGTTIYLGKLYNINPSTISQIIKRNKQVVRSRGSK